MFLLKQSTHRMLVQYDREIGHRFVPNQRARLTNEQGGYYVVTNSQGFRSDFDFEPAEKHRPRILMFGDSYTAGDNVCNSERYSDVLAQMTGCEVYNYGISGSGTDQHLLAFRKFAKQVEADLIVICVQIDSFQRIRSTHRPSIDRVTGQQVNVPKPFFKLIDGRLQLENVPVPIERPICEPLTGASNGKRQDELLDKIHDLYCLVPGLKQMRNSPLLADAGSRLITEFKRLRGHHPYPDILSDQTEGWKLMEAILRQFIAEADPLPVVIFPIPTRDFYLIGMEPVYQSLFEKLDSPKDGVHVGDVSTRLAGLPYQTRLKLSFEQGGHFTPFANRLVAEQMCDFLRARNLIGKPQDPPPAVTPRPPAKRSLPRRAEDQYVLGISCFYHNSAAALIRNGQIVAAAEEERFSRLKNDRRYPRHAINYCLEEAGIDQNQLAAVAFYDDSALTFERILHGLMAADVDAARNMWKTIVPDWARTKLHFPRLIREWLKFDGPVLQGNHHRSHAASCFYPSPFETAAILTVDGVGEWATASLGHGRGRSLQLLKEMAFPNSLGLLYSAFTHFTGFKVNSGEYKMMGLAPYGQPIYTQQILDNIVDLKEDGSLQLNMEYFSFLHDTKTTSAKFDELFGGPRRRPDGRITRREMDIARSIQDVTEEAVIRMARHAKKLTGETSLCLAGGVALNCVANGKLMQQGIFDRLWIQPAAGDSGCALGVALDVWHNHFGRDRTVAGEVSSQGGSYLGPEFSEDEVKAYLDTHGYPHRILDADARNRFLSQQLASGKVVGHFSGRLEFGPRSLGARSILGDVRNTEMQTTLNLRIKYRESFRPFAPAVLLERAAEYFELDRESPYMLIVAPVKTARRLPSIPSPTDEHSEDLLPIVRQLRSDIPAVTHIDYSARIQTVRREHHADFYDLIKQFEQDTGYGVLVNTSFNVRGEPIVCTPYDAYRCFMRTEMDVLAMGNCILMKHEQPPWPEGKGEGLENEDLDAVADDKSTDYEKRIAAMFDQHFWPAVLQAKQKGLGLIRIGENSAACSLWHDAAVTSPEPSEFQFGAALQASDASARDYAAAITARWHDPEAAKHLETTLVKILDLGRKHPAEEDESAEISESVYVMF